MDGCEAEILGMQLMNLFNLLSTLITSSSSVRREQMSRRVSTRALILPKYLVTVMPPWLREWRACRGWTVQCAMLLRNWEPMGDQAV